MTTYAEIRDQIQPGDVVAFAGRAGISRLIQVVTRSPISHVALVSHLEAGSERRVVLIEVTSLGGDPHVQLVPLSQHVERYDGAVYWLPLALDVRAHTDAAKLRVWALAQLGRPYDYMQAVGSALDDLPLVPDMREDFARWFCSELVCAGLELAGSIGPINASTQTPGDVVALPIYGSRVQLSG